MSGFLTGLFSQSPNRASSSNDNKENQAVDDGGMHSNAVAGPSNSAASPGQKAGMSILEDKHANDDSLMYGVELDISMLDQPPAAITSSGFYGTPKAGRTEKTKSNSKTSVKGKGKARDDAPVVRPPRRVMEDSFQPVRVYRCPPSDQPLYTLDRARRTITIHATDADSSYWPSKAHQRSTIFNSSTGTVSFPGAGLEQQPASSPSKRKDWHEPVNSETKQCLVWKQKCGAGLAGLLGLEGRASSSIDSLADQPR